MRRRFATPHPNRRPRDRAAQLRNAELRARGAEEGLGWLSINRYGAVCLNANRVFFGDIDSIPDRGGRVSKKLIPWEAALERVETVASEDTLAFRVYRTYAGVRVIELTRTHSPTAEATLEIMRRLGCDPHFIRLTRTGQNFRSRLTPKPWRSDPRAVNFNWRDVDPREYLQIARWKVADYVCTIGVPPAVLRKEIERIVTLHDEWCQVSRADLPLA